MTKEKELTKNSLIIGVGKIITSIVGFVLLPIYARELSVADYGLVDVIVVFVTLSGSLITLRLELSLFRWIVDVRDKHNDVATIISTILSMLGITISIASIIFIAVSIFLDLPYSHLIYLYALTTVLFNVLVQVPRALGNNLVYAKANVILGVSSGVISVVLLLAFKLGVGSLLIGYIAGNIVALVYIIFKAHFFKYIKKIKKSNLHKDLLRYSVPMIPDQLSNLGIFTGTKIVVVSTLGLVASGLYAVAGRFASIMLSVIDVFEVAWIESVAVNINDPKRDEYFSKVLNNVTKLFISMATLLILAIAIVFPLVIDNDFLGAFYIIPILVMAYLWNNSAKILGAIFLGLRKTTNIMATTIIAATVSLCGTLILANYIGLWAPVIAVMLAYMVLSLSRYYVLKTKLGVQVKFSLKYQYSVLFLFLIALFIYYLKLDFMILIALSLVVSALLVYINLNVYKIVLGIIKDSRIKKNDFN